MWSLLKPTSLALNARYFLPVLRDAVAPTQGDVPKRWSSHCSSGTA